MSSVGTDQRKSQRSSSGGVVKRWGGEEVVFTDGFLAVPLVFLKNLASVTEFGMSPAEVVFILEVMTFKWGSDKPFPSYKRLAEQMGVSEAYVRKIARQLEEKGLLKREEREGTTNRFDFAPLFDRLAEMGREVEQIKEEMSDEGDSA